MQEGKSASFLVKDLAYRLVDSLSLKHVVIVSVVLVEVFWIIIEVGVFDLFFLRAILNGELALWSKLVTKPIVVDPVEDGLSQDRKRIGTNEKSRFWIRGCFSDDVHASKLLVLFEDFTELNIFVVVPADDLAIVSTREQKTIG